MVELSPRQGLMGTHFVIKVWGGDLMDRRNVILLKEGIVDNSKDIICVIDR